MFPCDVGDRREKGLMTRFAAREDTNLTAENLQCIRHWNTQFLGYDPATGEFSADIGSNALKVGDLVEFKPGSIVFTLSLIHI